MAVMFRLMAKISITTIEVNLCSDPSNSPITPLANTIVA